jgi:outer membrane protein assembly factor BamB
VGPYYLIAMLNQNINVWYNGTAITVYIESSGDHFSSYTQDLSNSCFHLAITKSSDTGLLIYINGSVQVNESTWTWDASATNNFNNIGCYAPYGSCWLYALPDGTKMDEFRIYNQTILTGTQINYDYNNWKNTKGYGNLETELDLCLPSWSCSLYEGCNISGINSCIAINDSNLCGINFTGNLSDYEQSCWYLPIVNESSEGNLTEWRMRQRWLNHTSWDGISYSTIPGLNQVNITIGPYTRSSPAIAEGMLYIGSGNGTLYQLNASNISQIIATYNAGGQIDSSPIVVDGMVYVGIYIDANPNGGRVLQLNATNISQVIHSLTVYGGISYSIPVIANGMLYIGSDGNFGTGILYQLNATDITQIIANYTMGEMYGTPAVADGMLYIGSLDGKIYQLNASNVGQSIANYTTTDYVKASPVVYNGSVYIGGYDGIFYQLNATNISKLIASNNFGSEIFSSAAISNGYVYVGEKLVTNRVYQLDANNISIEIANYNASIYIHSSPAIADGMLYFADDNGVIYQLNASNISQLIATYDVGTGYIYAQISSPAVANGYVYIGMLDGKVYQLNANNISLPNNITSNCTPNWTCDIYSACLPNNTMPCQTIADLNFCGTNFTGNMSDYDMNCTYILPSVLNTTSQDFVEATADNMTKIIVGLGRIAVLLGVVLAGIGISYVIRKLLMKR